MKAIVRNTYGSPDVLELLGDRQARPHGRWRAGASPRGFNQPSGLVRPDRHAVLRTHVYGATQLLLVEAQLFETSTARRAHPGDRIRAFCGPLDRFKSPS